jgi:pentatricopeptide repeat protein
MQGAHSTRAVEVFELMQSSGCKPDVVTYTALITSYERDCMWGKALEVYQSLRDARCEPDSILYNALLDLLWDTGETHPHLFL